MDDRYRDIYRELFDSSHELPNNPPTQLLKTFIKESESDLLRDKGYRLRPDARLFILTNFAQMVLLPLQRAGRIDVNRILQFARDDIRFIIERAADMQPAGVYRPEERELSGHAIVGALSKHWSAMRMRMPELWD